MRVRSWHLALGLCVLCAGCDLEELVNTITTHSQLGAISPDTPNLFGTPRTNATAPDTATHGVPFQVSVQTHGNRCLKGIDRTDVSYVAPDTAVVRPYDFVNSPCASGDVSVIISPHTTIVTFANPGAGVVRFEGTNEQDGTLVTITRTVVIR